MGCNCRKGKDKREKVAYTRNIARRWTQSEKEDTQIYRIGEIYAFEPINKKRKNIVEYIRYNNGNR